MKLVIRLAVAAIAILSLTLASSAEAATLHIFPTDLAGAPRVNGEVSILTAFNANNQAVRDNAKISDPNPTTGEIKIEINDANVRAITVLVQAGGAQNATVQNLLVAEQTTSVALPAASQISYTPYAPSCCECTTVCRHGFFGRLFGR